MDEDEEEEDFDDMRRATVCCLQGRRYFGARARTRAMAEWGHCANQTEVKNGRGYILPIRLGGHRVTLHQSNGRVGYSAEFIRAERQGIGLWDPQRVEKSHY